MSHLTPNPPARLVLLGGEGLCAGSTPLWHQIVSRAPDNLQDVVCLPTALAGQKIGTVERHTRLAADFLAGLGGNLRTVAILSREDAASQDHLESLRSASALYLSGGEPRVLASILRDTFCWDAVQQRYANGALLLVASGGATAALGTTGIAPRRPHSADIADLAFETFAGLGLLPDTVILPYISWLSDLVIELVRSTCPPATRVLGLDDQAALIWDGSQWLTEGMGCITFWDAGGTCRVIDAGQPMPAEWLPSQRKAAHDG